MLISRGLNFSVAQKRVSFACSFKVSSVFDCQNFAKQLEQMLECALKHISFDSKRNQSASFQFYLSGHDSCTLEFKFQSFHCDYIQSTEFVEHGNDEEKFCVKEQFSLRTAKFPTAILPILHLTLKLEILRSTHKRILQHKKRVCSNKCFNTA